MKGFLTICAVVAFVGLIAWYEYGLWHECLQDHSWGYCNRVLSSK